MSTQQLWFHRNSHETIRTPAGQPELCRRKNRSFFMVFLAIAAVCLPVSGKNHYNRKNPQGNQAIIRATPENVRLVAAQYGLEITGETPPDDDYAALVEAPASLSYEQIEDLLLLDSRVLSVSPVHLAALPSISIEPAQEDVVADLQKQGDFTTPCLAEGFDGLVWSGYADQEAVRDIRLHEAHETNGDCGKAVVAVLDTGVDADHPLLEGALTVGYDFITESAGIPEESTDLEQSVAAVLEQSVAAVLEQSVAAVLEQSAQTVLQGEGELLILGSMGLVLEQSVAAVLERESLPPFYGHGTMVSGLIRVAAPGATIMPLRVFDSTGSAHVFDVIRAIHFAVDNGADVIAMSFSTPDYSIELMRAVQYARQNGVVCVGAAGNQGEQTLVYPAAFPSVISVGALDGYELSPFSNYGSQLLDLAAPGAGVVSAYPGGLYGAGWGTSFSTPLVAGAIALLVHEYPEKSIASVQAMENDLRQGSETIDSLQGDIGSGRLDVYATVLEAKNK